ncbi:transporter substrate-binding domain-containing protein [Adhaeretor mobilis]|uniref:ABC transporter arginine-binding protein 1 n=1 Tax=Adhaeretor mobilis TaxID=1930276 RepID=A0A517MQR5_9BACT|nr:transporter substrate-binding domain-containing protein [Adhaeretor mobilis]QDS97228.1 ABC transporter arginine-binding protein 1 precursor [Adhaeretor mobilis]
MNSYHSAANRNDPAAEPPATVQLLANEQTRQCPYCNEQISVNARKCWRCHEYFSLPLDDLDDRAYQFARREVLQDCVLDIKKWITRLGCGSLVAVAIVALLGLLRFQDVLEEMVADRVAQTAGPVLEDTQEKLDASDEVLDDVEDKIRLAQHRISQFDWLQSKLSETETAVLQIEDARQGLESRAEKLADQFGQMEHRFISAKRELRHDREQRLEDMLGSFANDVVTVEKLNSALEQAGTPVSHQLVEALAPLKRSQIDLISPRSLSTDHPAVLFSPTARLKWQFGRHAIGKVKYQVQFDTQPDFRSKHAQQAITRLTNHELPVDFPHGPVYWRVDALSDDGQVIATSSVGNFEFYSDSIDRIRQTGIVRVGVTYSSQGEFAYYDEQQRQLTGYDIELARWLAAHLLPDTPDVQPVFHNYDWRQLLKSVGRNEVDFLISTITITPEREEEFGLNFSQPYYKTSQAFVVLKKGGFRTGSSLLGRRLAVQSGTSSEMVAEAFTEPENLSRSTNVDESFDALMRGRVDAIVTDYDFAQGHVRTLGDAAAIIAVQETDFPEDYTGIRSEEYGIAVAKPEAYLLTRINNAIASASRSNVLESLKLQFVMNNPKVGPRATKVTKLAMPPLDKPGGLNPLRR